MRLKVPPIVIVFSFGGLMYVLAEFLPIGYFDFFGRRILAKVLFGLAILVMIVAVIQFFRAKTTVDPQSPDKASRLVVSGVYSFTRNPMYLGMLLMLLAWGLILGNAFNTLLAALFVAYMNKFQIVPEEEALTEIFGKKYQKYCLDVRRWF